MTNNQTNTHVISFYVDGLGACRGRNGKKKKKKLHYRHTCTHPKKKKKSKKIQSMVMLNRKQ